MTAASSNPSSTSAPPACGLCWLTTGRFAIALAGLVFLLHPDVLLGWNSFYARDFLSFGYPLAHYSQASWRSGAIPLWNPHNFAGLPFLAQWNTMVLYPGSVLFVVFPLPWSLNVFNLLHQWAGGVGMFVLARHWTLQPAAAAVAGVAYAFGAIVVSALMWPNNIAALGWMPCVLYLSERAASEAGKWRPLAALALAMQGLTGAPEIIAMTWAGVLAFAVARAMDAPVDSSRAERLKLLGRAAWRLAPCFVLALGLLAVQLAPFLELLRQSQRHTQYAGDAWHLSWAGIGNLLVPLFRTYPDRDGLYFQAAQQWVVSYYPGATVVCLALLGLWTFRSRPVICLTCFGALAAWLAMGSEGGLYPLVRRAVPVLGMIRFPIKWLVPALVVWPLLAGFGLRAVLDRRATPGVCRWVCGGVVIVGLGLLVASAVVPGPGEQADATWTSGAKSLACVVALWWCVTQRGWIEHAPWVRAVAVAVVVFLDLFLANRSLNPVVPSAYLAARRAEIQPWPGLGTNRVMVSRQAHERLDATLFPEPLMAVRVPRQALMLNANLLEGVGKLDGFFSLYPARPAAVIAQLGLDPERAPGLLSFLGVSHTNDAVRPWLWVPRGPAQPMLNLVAEALVLDATNAYRHVFSSGFDPQRQVVLAAPAPGLATPAAPGPGRILESQVTPHAIDATIESAGATFLTIAQSDDPGWHATLDGRSAPMLRANVAFQAIVIPEGRHQVKLRFRPRSFMVGAGVSLAAIIGAVVWLLAAGKSRGQGYEAHDLDLISDRPRL